MLFRSDILRSLGVDVIVSGGQTMNPSTADILSAIEEVGAESVIVLPDNSNIRMAAEAAVATCEDVRAAIVPTKTVLQAFSAMFAVDMEADLETNTKAMTEAILEIRDGEVTTAVRDSAAADGTPIHAGDVMGIMGGAIRDHRHLHQPAAREDRCLLRQPGDDHRWQGTEVLRLGAH